MRTMTLVFSAIALLGCTPPPAQVTPLVPPTPRITIVPTHTPGVSFVIVRPSPDKDTPTNMYAKLEREYVLLCDGRPADGMHCAVPQEAALARVSEHPRVGAAKSSIELWLGKIGGGGGEAAEPKPDDKANDKDKKGEGDIQ